MGLGLLFRTVAGFNCAVFDISLMSLLSLCQV